jgi:hypothetical protein
MDQTRPQESMQLLPEVSDELGPSVRNDGLRHTMQAQDVRNIQFSVLLSPVEGAHQNGMSGLGKSVDDYPNGVKLAAGEDRSRIPKKIMPSGSQGMNHSGQLKIMSGIVLFMRAQLT